MSALERLNALPAEAAQAELLACCGSREWARRMAAARPFDGRDALLDRADREWWALGEDDWREAFRSHPPIGGRHAEAGQTERERTWSAGEQAGAQGAAEATLTELAKANRAYLQRFGYLFIASATGRTADELLGLLRERLAADPARELRTAAAQQAKITVLRLQKLLADGAAPPPHPLRP